MIYDRKTKTILPEDIYKSRTLNFYYNTVIGGFFRLLARLPIISKICSLSQKRNNSKKNIDGFIKKYNIDMQQYDGNYNTFNDFFVRKRKHEHIDHNQLHLIAPADSCLLVKSIRDGVIYTIKNRSYTIGKFLKNNDLAKEYEGGLCLIFRLRVYDYHRFGFIDNGTISGTKRIRGVLDSVNTRATGKFTLSSNYRVHNFLQTDNFSEVIFSEVGAMLVGQITQTHTGNSFKKGDEKGYFEYGGSTIVLLLKKNIVEIDEDILNQSAIGVETKVRYGEKIGVRVV